MKDAQASRTADGGQRTAEKNKSAVRGLRSAVRAAAMLVLLLPAAFAAQAQSAGAFARIGFGARGVAAGNALVADLSGDASPYYNPALAPFTAQQNLAATAGFLSFDRELQYLQFAAPLKPSAGIAGGLTHLRIAGIDGRDDSGYHTEDLSADEYAFFLAFGTRASERLSIGAALKFFRADYLDTREPALAFGLDLGLAMRLTERLSVGVAAQDLLARYEWEDAGGGSVVDRFPARLRLGGAYRLWAGRAQLRAEVESRFASRETLGGDGATEQDLLARVGGSVQLVAPLALHAGLDRLGAGSESLRPSAGFTVAQTLGQLPLRAGYAFVRETGVGGSIHLITLRLFL